MKGHVHLINLEYGHGIAYRYKTHIHFVANKMDGYLQFSTNYKSDFVIYLLECKRCHIHYVGKAETYFNLRLNNHRKDAYKADSIPASRHFATKDLIFNRVANFIITDQIRKSTLSNPETRDFKT